MNKYCQQLEQNEKLLAEAIGEFMSKQETSGGQNSSNKWMAKKFNSSHKKLSSSECETLLSLEETLKQLSEEI